MLRLKILSTAIVSLAVVAASSSQTWTRVNATGTAPPSAGLTLLLTDGSVLVHRPSSPDWYKLKPNSAGSYINGTWTKIASMQAGYGPLYYASAVLANGRVVVTGGEYNFGNGVWTTLGAWYDPDANVWTPLAAPAGWTLVGDTQCAVMPDGTFAMANLSNTQMSKLDPTSLLWSNMTSNGKSGRFNEENWTLMPDGTLLTENCSNAPSCQRYIPASGTWISAGSTPVGLVDPPSIEIGPAVLMANGKVVVFGATGHNAVYTPGANLLDPGSWAAAPDFPTDTGGQLAVADGPACLLPNGHVLVGASPDVFESNTKFFEYDGTNLIPVPATPNSPGNSCFQGNMLMLPNGQVLYTDQSNDIQIYTPTGAPLPAWRPTITNFPSNLTKGTSFVLTGKQFNGLSQCCNYGDDSSNATNYPIVRLTNIATGHVQYLKTHDHSTMAVATGNATVTTQVFVPNTIEDGLSMMEVIANGIASDPVTVDVGAFTATITSIDKYEGVDKQGGLAEILASDDQYFSLGSIEVKSLGQVASAVADVHLPSSTFSQLRFTVESHAVDTSTLILYLYNWNTGLYEFIGAKPEKGVDQASVFTVLNPPAKYFDANHNVRMVVRCVMPAGVNRRSGAYHFKIDQLKVGP